MDNGWDSMTSGWRTENVPAGVVSTQDSARVVRARRNVAGQRRVWTTAGISSGRAHVAVYTLRHGEVFTVQ